MRGSTVDPLSVEVSNAADTSKRSATRTAAVKHSPFPSGTRGGAPADLGAVDPSPNRTGKPAGGPQEGSAEEAAGSHPDLLTPEYRHSPLREIHMNEFFFF